MSALSDGPVDVVVVGAGVVGLSVAVRLAESGVRVRVDYAESPARSTSAAAGAVWDPYLVEPSVRVRPWAAASLAEFTRLAEDTDETGVRLLRGTQESREPCDMPFWADLVSARRCHPQELHPGYVTGWTYAVPVIDAPAYLNHLERRLRAAGGTLRHHAHASLTDAAREAPVVVNCTGTGARELVPDPLVTPLAGQLVVVRNPGLDTFFCDDTPNCEEYTYFYPHGDIVTLGGSQVPGSTSRTPDPLTAREIIRRCADIEPRLRTAEVLEHRIGSRPMRPEARLETEQLPSGGRIVHNYGHGAAGVTLAWGCAMEAAAMAVTGTADQQHTTVWLLER